MPTRFPLLGFMSRAALGGLTVGLFVAILAGPLGASAHAQSDASSRALLAVLAALENDYLHEVERDELIEAAIESMIEALDDPYTSYIPPRTAAIQGENRRGEFGGIGASFNKPPGEPLRVTRVYEGLPAHSAGLLPSDEVTEVDGVAVQELDVEAAIDLIRGRIGTPVALTVLRGDGVEPRLVTVERALIDVPVVNSATLPGNVGYVQIETFENQLVLFQLRSHLTALQEQQISALVLDLRGNGGGFLAQGIAVADEFLQSGQIVYTRSQGVTRVGATADAQAVQLPLVVLIDRDSASASEIVAAALQDHGRAVIVGEPSFGKGVGQSLLPLPNGGELKYVTFEWLRPSRASVHEVGVQPDVVVPRPAAEAATTPTLFGRDGFLRPGEAFPDPETDPALLVALEQLASALAASEPR